MFIILYCFWLILNGRITLEICLFGLPVCAAVFLFSIRFLEYSMEKEKKLYQSIPFLLSYVFVLLLEILKANLQVIRITLFAHRSIKPVRVRFEVPLKSKIAKVILANSITLTPGTITAELEDNRYLVHCLTEEMAEGINQSVFVSMLLKWEQSLGIGKE